MLALAYLVKYHTVNVENRVRVPGSTNTIGCSGQHTKLPFFLKGKHSFRVFSSILKVVLKWLIVQRIRILCYERRDTSSSLVEPTKDE